MRVLANLPVSPQGIILACRGAGILIIHAPSDTMDFYKDYPQRRAMLLVPPVTPPVSLGLASPPLPIDPQSRSRRACAAAPVRR